MEVFFGVFLTYAFPHLVFCVFPMILFIGHWCESNFYPGSFVLTGLIETAAIPYLGLQIGELSSDEKAEILFLDQAYGFSLSLSIKSEGCISKGCLGNY